MSPPTITIREATDADGPALAALIAGVLSEYDNCLFVPAEFPELAAVASHYARHGGCIWVAEQDGRLCGSFAVAMTHEPGVAEFFKVYLAKEVRGRGVAGKLFALALAHARRQGARLITLWSDSQFHDGHRFYERLGFVRGPGVTALHDASGTLQYNFRLALEPDPQEGTRSAADPRGPDNVVASEPMR